jgi:hypothetical protein
LKQIEVQIGDSYELQDFLNSTMLSTYHLIYGLNPITVTLIDSSQNVSADLQTSIRVATNAWTMIRPTIHVFNIPDDWLYFSSLTVRNPENYPVSWIVTLTFNQRITVSEAVDRMILGITSTVVGAVILGVAVYRIKPVRAESTENSTF